jgi:hypothetical protein
MIAGLFRTRLLKVLLDEGVISQQIVDLLLIWNHHSGFNVQARGRIHGADRKAIENVASYMSPATLSVERVRYNRAEDHVTVSKKPFGSSREEFRSHPVGNFLALLASHIPAPYESLTYYYGVYSSSYRGKQRREKREEQETDFVLIDTGKGTAGGKPISTWARLIRRIFEVDPLRCRRCGAEMRLIAFITDFRQTSKILEHIGEQTIRPRPLTAKTFPARALSAGGCRLYPGRGRLCTGPDLSGLNPPRNTPRPGNVRPKTRGSAPTGSGSRQNPSARLEVDPSVGRLSAHEPQGMP